MQQPASGPPVSDYRLAPALGARFAGALVVVLGLVLVVLTLLVVLLDLPVVVLVIAAVLGLAGVATAYAVLRRVSVVHLGETGYRVRLLRGAGVDQARWTDVAEAVTATPAGTPVLVLKLRDGTTTTIAVQVLDADREEFVRDLQRHLQHGHGLRPLS